jgi:hypothetical protein
MRGVHGCGNQTKRNKPLPEVRSRLFENSGIHFILHYSFFIPANAELLFVPSTKKPRLRRASVVS